MRYWNENPETWDEICCQGISLFLAGEPFGPVYETMCEWTLEPVAYRNAWRKLCNLAQKEISEREASYWETLEMG